MNPRIQALKVLSDFLVSKKNFSNLQIWSNNLSEQDKRFFFELVFGVLRFYIQLEYISKTAIKKPLKKKDFDVYIIILLGIYQLLYLSIEDHAAIYESVELTTKIKKKHFKSFVNAVLRQVQRNVCIENDDIKIFDKDKNPIIISEDILYSYPLWILEKIKSSFPDEYIGVLQATNLRPNISLRLNLNKVSQDQMLEILDNKNILAKKSELSSYGINITQSINPLTIPFFEDGFFVVQNESAQVLGEIVDLKDGMHVLDACSAPGGKTTHLLQINPNIQLTSTDISASRLLKVQENLNRLNLKANVLQADMNLKWTNQKFDLIILDAPCSGIGVVSKHPEIKLNLTQEKISTIVELQRNILKNLWQMLNKNGSLVYITCSILAEETEQQIEYFLNQFDDVEVVSHNIGKNGKYGFYILPYMHRHGFYYSKLLKK